MKKLIALAILLVLPALAQAQVPGYLYDSYYTYHSDGYYYANGYPYTRYWVPATYYYSCGYKYVTPGYYSYSRYYAPAQPYVAPAVTYKDAGWKSKLLDLAAERDRIEGKIVADAIEQKYFMEAVTSLGLQRPGMNHSYLGNYYGAVGVAPGYAASYPGAYGQASYSTLNLGAFGANASTGYGHAYSAIANLYQQPNLEVLFQQASRLTENAQKLSGQATSEFQATVGMQGGYQAKVAEILAKGKAAQDVLNALQGSGWSVEKKEYKVGPADPPATLPPGAAPGAAPAPGIDAKQLEAAWKESAKNRCASCHGATKAEGKFNVWEAPAQDLGRRLVILSRLVTNDMAKRMPRKADGSPAEALPEQELNLWKLYLTQ